MTIFGFFGFFSVGRLTTFQCHSLLLGTNLSAGCCVMAEGAREGCGVGHLASLQPFAIRLEPDMAPASRITHNPKGTALTRSCQRAPNSQGPSAGG